MDIDSFTREAKQGAKKLQRERPRIFLLMPPPRGMNIKDAEQFGDFVGPVITTEPLLTTPFGVEDTVKRLRATLNDYTSADFIFPIGSPIVIGLATSIAADYSVDGKVSFLKWERGTTRYIAVTVELIEEDI